MGKRTPNWNPQPTWLRAITDSPWNQALCLIDDLEHMHDSHGVCSVSVVPLVTPVPWNGGVDVPAGKILITVYTTMSVQIVGPGIADVIPEGYIRKVVRVGPVKGWWMWTKTCLTQI